LYDGLSVIIVRVACMTAMSQRFGFLCNIMRCYFADDYERLESGYLASK
jgi:hypothetical protein